MVAIGPVVSEEKSFEIVDGRRTDGGRRTTEPAYTISSPGAFGSGELKMLFPKSCPIPCSYPSEKEIGLKVLLGDYQFYGKNLRLDICVQRTRMPPPSALSKMAPWLRYWLLSDNYRFLKADLCNIEETNEEPCRSKRLAFSLQSNLGYEYETYMFSLLPIHSISLNYDLDL